MDQREAGVLRGGCRFSRDVNDLLTLSSPRAADSNNAGTFYYVQSL